MGRERNGVRGKGPEGMGRSAYELLALLLRGELGPLSEGSGLPGEAITLRSDNCDKH